MNWNRWGKKSSSFKYSKLNSSGVSLWLWLEAFGSLKNEKQSPHPHRVSSSRWVWERLYFRIYFLDGWACGPARNHLAATNTTCTWSFLILYEKADSNRVQNFPYSLSLSEKNKTYYFDVKANIFCSCQTLTPCTLTWLLSYL